MSNEENDKIIDDFYETLSDLFDADMRQQDPELEEIADRITIKEIEDIENL